jgi:hypothetical protein
MLYDHMSNPKYSIPEPGERCACPQPRVAKRAALLFDRIYVPPWRDRRDNIPSCVKFDVPKTDEYFEAQFETIKKQILFNSPKLKKPISTFTADDMSNIIDKLFVRVRVECFRLSGYSVTPVYERQERYLLDYPSGNTLVYQAALENLPKIIEAFCSIIQITFELLSY